MNPTLVAAYARCSEITRSRGANFSVGFEVLPEEKKRAVHAAYAFCRLADDLADEPQFAADPRELLARWQDELARVYRGCATHPVGVALADAVRRFPLPRRAFADLIRGCEQDLHFEPPFDVSGVRRYCDLVATPIGEVSLAIFGTVRPGTRERARHLAHALQWTNILRDVAEDAERGRVYLPRTWWAEAGIDPEQLHESAARPGVLAVLRRGVAVAREHYESAADLPERLCADARPAVRLMAGVYRRVLDRIEADPARVLAGRIELSSAEKDALRRAEA